MGPILTVVKRKKNCVQLKCVSVCVYVFVRIFGIEGQFLYKTNNNKKNSKIPKKNSLDNLTKKNKNNVVRDCKFLTKFCFLLIIITYNSHYYSIIAAVM